MHQGETELQSALTLFTCTWRSGGGGGGGMGTVESNLHQQSPGWPTIPSFKAALAAPLKSCHPVSFMAVCGFRGARKSQPLKCKETLIFLRMSQRKDGSITCHTAEDIVEEGEKNIPSASASAVSPQRPSSLQVEDCLTHTERCSTSVFIRT